ncbi:MAG: hypothetical protein KDB27_21775 [Planctomycetales bacterium]|nr:hypothetical protein [Planctomycetales bacterium]
MTAQKKVGLSLLASAGVLVAIIAPRIWEVQRPQPPVAPPAIVLPPLPEAVAATHLEDADAQCKAMIESHVQSLDDFFVEASDNLTPFARRTFGWKSKWCMICDLMPGGGHYHQEFVRTEFEQQVFDNEQLQQAIEQLVANFMQQLQFIEQDMLVQIRADVADFPDSFACASWNDDLMQETFNGMVATAVEEAGEQLPYDISVEMVSWIVGEVFGQLAVRTGVSTGIISAGAASSWFTFGVGIVAGLIIDQIVHWIWEWWADPIGELTGQLDKQLKLLRRELKASVASELTAFAEQRSQIRRDTVLALLRQSE